MGLLDQVVGGLLGGAGGSASPMQGVLLGLLGGQSGRAGQAGLPTQGLGGFGGGAPALGGGLGGLVSAFEQAGLGNVVQSWIGNGPNQPVSPQQLRSVFGDDRVQAMASQSGMGQEDFLGQLSQHLPRVVDAMTPQGQLPDEGTVSV